MTEVEASAPTRVGGPSAGADAGDAAERSALDDVGLHAQQAWSALRERVEHCGISAKRALMRALLCALSVAAAMGFAIAIGCAGLSRLIDGAAVGLAHRLGSAWQADVAVGGMCLVLGAAVFAALALPARSHRRTRRRATLAAASPAASASDDVAGVDTHGASRAAADHGLASALTALGDDVARAVDVRARIARHPVAAGASAFAIGVAAALAVFDGRRPSDPTATGPIAPVPTRTTPTQPARGRMQRLIEDVLVPIAVTWLRDPASGAGDTPAHRPPVKPTPAAPSAA